MQRIKRFQSRVSRGYRNLLAGQGGFTLIELLVVVIILGVLAAVVTVNVARFAGRGETEAAATEWDNVQLALDAFMAENKLVDVDGQATAVKDFAALPIKTGVSGFLYPQWIRQSVTSKCYTWEASGEVKTQTVC